MLLHKINLESEDQKEADAHYEHPLQSKSFCTEQYFFQRNMMFSTENKNLSKKTISKRESQS